MPLSLQQKLRIKASFAAASLVPGAVLAAGPTGVNQNRPLPPSERSAITQTVEGQPANTQVALQIFINGGRETISFPGGQTAHFKLTHLEQSLLSEEQRSLYGSLHALASEATDESWVALKRILTTAGVDRSLMTRTATIDPASLRKLAAYLDSIGLTASEAKTGHTIAAALAHDRVIIALGENPTPGQEKVAGMLADLSREKLEEMRAEVGAPAIKDPALAKRSKELRARVIDRALVEHLIARAHQRGFSVETPHLFQRLREIGPRPDGEGARADWYRRIVESQGHQFRDGVNQMNVIGLRAFDLDSGRNHNGFNGWNDTLAFVWNDGGRWQVREFAATTDPGFRSAWDAPDANGDGTGDVAHLLPGQYPYTVGTHKGVGGAGVPEINVPVARDTNHNGDIEGAEEKASRARGDVGYGINIHWGPGYEGGGVGPHSLGCQVTVLDSSAYHAQVTPLLEANRGQMLYTLVDMERVA